MAATGTDEFVALALAVRRGQVSIKTLTAEQQHAVRRILSHASDVQLAGLARKDEQPRHRAYGRP